MTTRLIIRTADTSRANWKALHYALRGQGLELHRYHAGIVDGGMCVVADAYHPDGTEEQRARQALAALPASLTVLH
ncbi:hypothetical protein [Caballeronia sp. S22]|uniref:hypothetical protein n=1 Tax=Caballeronia sp. S22 TaxID=3137182 RepID=UPI0035312B40